MTTKSVRAIEPLGFMTYNGQLALARDTEAGGLVALIMPDATEQERVMLQSAPRLVGALIAAAEVIYKAGVYYANADLLAQAQQWRALVAEITEQES